MAGAARGEVVGQVVYEASGGGEPYATHVALGGPAAAPRAASAASSGRLHFHPFPPAPGPATVVPAAGPAGPGPASDLTAYRPGPGGHGFLVGAGGAVMGFDAASGRALERYDVRPPGPVFSCHASPDGLLVAAGSKERVVLFDRRTGKQVAVLQESFSDDVTQVRFTQDSRYLVAGGEDGLITIFDVGKGTFDEDDALAAVLSTDTSIAKLGFYGKRGDMLWCTTNIETLHCFNWHAAVAEDDAAGIESTTVLEDARGDAARAAREAGVAELAKVDYLIGCQYDAVLERLTLAAGTAEGAVGIFPISKSKTKAKIKIKAPDHVCCGGHRTVVRACEFHNARRGGGGGGGGAHRQLVTAGEDGRVCVWTPGGGSGFPAPDSGPSATPMNVDAAPFVPGGRALGKAAAPPRRFAPY